MNTEDERQILSDTDDGLRNLMAACQDEDEQKMSLEEIEISTGQDESLGADADPINFSGSSSGKSSEKSKKSAGTPTKSGAGTPRRTKPVFSEEELEKLKKPLDLGWRREIVWRQGLTKSGGRNGDVYYYAPETTQKLRSMPEVLAFLHKQNLTEITGENFSFVRQHLKLGSPNELERGAHLSGHHSPSAKKTPKSKTSPTTPKLQTPKIKFATIKKEVVDESTGAIVVTESPEQECRIPSSLGQQSSEGRESDFGTPSSSVMSSTVKRKYAGSESCGESAQNGDVSDEEKRLVVAFPSKNPIQKKKKKVDKKINKSIEEVCQTVRNELNSLPSPADRTTPPPPCPGQICDTRIPCQTICAKCTLSFHIQCVTETGKILSGKKDPIFICGPCYAETLAVKPDDSIQVDAKPATQRRSGDVPIKVVGHFDSRLLLPEKQKTPVNWMSDVCAYVQLLKLIFKELTVVDLLRARCVCKTWKDISSLPELWKFASLERCKIGDWSKANVFFRQYQVQTLDFFGVRTTVKAFSDALKEMDFLNGFHFGCVVPCVLTSLKDSAKVLNRMEYLRVTVTEQRKPVAPDNEVVVDFELFKHMCKIKYLRIMSARGFVIKGQNLANLYFCEQLTCLSLLDVKDLTDADVVFLKRMPLLQTLQIGYCTKFTSKAFELISNLKNLEKLRLECGDSSALVQTLLVLPKLKVLCLTKFTVNDLLMGIIAKKRLHHFTIWSDFDSPTACAMWSALVGNMDKLQDSLNMFTLGFLGRHVALDRAMKGVLDIFDLVSSSIRFAVTDDMRKGYLKSIKIDEFVKFAKKYIPYVDVRTSKEDFLAGTR